jgi:NADH pyrophosphatase NudC (nudix superfamily)
MIIAVAAALTVGAVVFTLFIRPQDIEEEVVASPTEALEARKVQIYENLRDLQFEYRVGKFSEADYQKSKSELQKELERVIKQIEVAESDVPAVAAAAAATYTCPHCQHTSDQKLKFCGECGKPMSGETDTPPAVPTCAKCGATFDREMKFCGECGEPMKGGAA